MFSFMFILNYTCGNTIYCNDSTTKKKTYQRSCRQSNSITFRCYFMYYNWPLSFRSKTSNPPPTPTPLRDFHDLFRKWFLRFVYIVSTIITEEIIKNHSDWMMVQAISYLYAYRVSHGNPNVGTEKVKILPFFGFTFLCVIKKARRICKRFH